MKKLSVILVSLFLLSGCYPNWYKPYGKIFRHMPEKGSPGFKLGWLHGCESGLGTQFGGAFMMTFYSWAKDPKISSYATEEKINPYDPQILSVKKKYGSKLDINWDDPNEIKQNFYDYNTVFWRVHIFCRHATLQTLKGSGITPPLPNQQRYNPAAHSIMNVWKFDEASKFNLVNW
ncbi:hypothetical protein N9C35_03010 [Flavobacteriaceae bacterium]|nr:hypothetical protein [Flavobacteriaceae bacterium]